MEIKRIVHKGTSNKDLSSILIYPSDYKEKKYPLLVFMHGAGERGFDLKFLQSNVCDGLIDDYLNRFHEYPAIFYAPQCPEGEKWSYYDAYGKEKIDITRDLEPALKTAKENIIKIANDFNVAKNEKAAYGLSMGGFAIWDLILRDNDFFSNVAIICAAGDPNYAKNAKNVPIWLFHGDMDDVVPVKCSRIMYDLLKDVNPNIKYTEYPGVNHGSWKYAFKEEGFYDFLFRRNKENKQ